MTLRIEDIRKTEFTKIGLEKAIIEGLNNSMKSIPIIVLYDDTGLQIFEKVTKELEEYYLRHAEVEIVENKTDQIIDYIPDGSAIIELGAGSIQKTQPILKALDKNKKNITYYALDLMENELSKSLSSLGEFQNIKLVGLWGTFEEGMDFAADLPKDVPKTILSFGFSIGNMSREEGASFIKNFQAKAMNPGDLFIVGTDRRKNPDKIILAYKNTSDFIMNGLNHINAIFDQQFIDRNNFEHFIRYNDNAGRLETYYKTKDDVTLEYTSDNNSQIEIKLKKNELIHIGFSYKYSKAETLTLFHNSLLSFVESWPDSKSQCDLNLAYKPPFYFTRNFESQESVPTIEEWDELWKSLDIVMMTMVSPELIYEKLIEFKHPLIFYVGHIPAFLDINLARYFKEKFTEPQDFADIFGRDMNPEMNDPTHPHSTVSDKWPDLNSIISFRDQVRQRLNDVYNAYKEKTMPRSLGRILWMSFEHHAIHLEKFLYMLVQFKYTKPPKGIVIPQWKPSSYSVPEPSLVTIPTQTITLGLDDNEYADGINPLSLPFGWDNEQPSRQVTVQSFKIQSRPVTNGEYLHFMKTMMNKECPSSWIPVDSSSFNYKVRTVFGPVNMNIAENWPVMLSQKQACHYAEWMKMRLPTEEELRCFFDLYTLHPNFESNIGFKLWHPTDVPHDQNFVQTLGSGWEWTSTIFNEHTGFNKSGIYPEYSFDFFDGKHVVILGGSWATHPRMIRRSFRNWCKPEYPYAFCSFRLCL